MIDFKKIFGRERYYIMGFVTLMVAITVIHISILQDLAPHVVLEELYYMPIFGGALLFGLRGAILAYVFASLSYTPFLFGHWTPTYLDIIDRVLHLVSSGVFAFLMGYLTDRLKRIQKETEKERYLAKIGQVATTIVHDLKNPLITIQGFAKRIQEQKGDIAKAAQIIMEAAQNMEKIVHNVLDFSKPVQLELKERDIGGIIKEAVELCRTKAEKAEVAISTHVPDDSIRIAIDGFHMQRTLVNLINNAIEASRSGQDVEISVTAKRHYLSIRIKDSGIGMDTESLDNLFVPFYSRKKGGTGLGMSIAKKIIDGHKGNIRIYSEEGIGTEVIIELPYS